jgi:release factor glutamine methyltransferase
VYDREPLQYLIGTVPFLNTQILVAPPTLIPRIETEQWVGDLLEHLKFLPHKPLTILDLCTGSGCIAIALAKNLPQATVYAVDIMPAAIELTKKNIEHNQVKNVQVIQSDLWQQVPQVKFDIIVSNPPYVTEQEWQELEPCVTNWEDKTALVAVHDGLDIIQRIIEQAPSFLQTPSVITKHYLPQLMIEIGYKQGKKVVDLMKATGFNDVTILQDLAQKDRVVIGSFAHVTLQAP